MHFVILCAAIIFNVSPLFADIIYFKDGSAVNGNVLRVTDFEIEFSTKEIPFDKQSRSNVLKIVYSNGKTVVFNEKAQSTQLKNPQVTNPQQYGIIPVEDTVDPNAPGNGKRPPKYSINIFGGIGPVGGDIMKTEKDKYQYPLPDDAYHTGEVSRPYSNNLHAGIFMDRTVFDRSISKNSYFTFGLRCIYTWEFVNQIIEKGYEETSPYAHGDLMRFHSLGIGPVLSVFWAAGETLKDWKFISETVDFGFTPKIFAVIGPIFAGTLAPGTAAADAGLIQKLPTTGFDGIKLSTGIGTEYNISWFNIGSQFYYSKCWITTKGRVYSDISRHTSLNIFSIDLYLGVNF
jgi:hypothetical protein